jgi:hypothetical protein
MSLLASGACVRLASPSVFARALLPSLTSQMGAKVSMTASSPGGTSRRGMRFRKLGGDNAKEQQAASSNSC